MKMPAVRWGGGRGGGGEDAGESFHQGGVTL